MATEKSELADAFEAAHKTCDGWRFSYEYPGYFVYTKAPREVWFTPDHSLRGHVSIDITDREGTVLFADEVPYEAPLSADALLAIVKPFLSRAEGM